jgi:hypothetical protein
MRIFLYIISLLLIAGSLQGKDNIVYIQNGDIKLGVNLELGGAITYLSVAESDENMINNYDWGRQIQMSFYSGPKPYIPESGQQPHERWAFLGWNPIQSGDVGGYKSKVTDYFHGEDSIYIKSIPMQWPLANVPGECFFESCIKIEGKIIKVNNRLVNNRKDKTQYTARSQEMPAVYVNAPYHRLITYKGDKPFQNDKISEIPQNSETEPKWSYWQATENWVAHLNDDDFGLGIFTSEVQSYIGGFSGKKGVGGTKDAPTGYCAPILKEILDHNIVYDYSCNLCVGSLKQIRNFAIENRKIKEELKYNFKSGRNHIYFTDAKDKGWPINNMLEVKPEKKVIYLNSPQIFYKLGDTFRFNLEAQFPANVKKVSLVCIHSENIAEDEYKLNILNDGLLHNYIVYLKNKNINESALKQFKIKIEFDDIKDSGFVKIVKFGID